MHRSLICQNSNLCITDPQLCITGSTEVTCICTYIRFISDSNWSVITNISAVHTDASIAIDVLVIVTSCSKAHSFLFILWCWTKALSFSLQVPHLLFNLCRKDKTTLSLKKKIPVQKKVLIIKRRRNPPLQWQSSLIWQYLHYSHYGVWCTCTYINVIQLTVLALYYITV